MRSGTRNCRNNGNEVYYIEARVDYGGTTKKVRKTEEPKEDDTAAWQIYDTV